MADLFDQLKSAGPVKKSDSSPAKLVSPLKTKKTNSLEELIIKHKSKSSEKRRESLPSPITVSTVLKKSKSQKARSLSPKSGAKRNVVKTLKVKLERKKLEEFLTKPLEEHANNIRKKQEKSKDKHPKTTPTKAQQKLFEPSVGQKKLKSPVLKQFNVKPCKVRIHRDNLKKLAKEFQNKNAVKKDGKLKNIKRPAISTSGDSPPSKKGKFAGDNTKVNKPKNNFFIKLNTSPSTKLEKKLKNISKSNSSSSEAFHNKMKNSKFNNTTMPTKFSRSELFRSFGKRYFNVHVKIERCTHPLMLTFESNERARRLQTKRSNKSKNLSVSFSEQVEIFGDSSDPDDSCDEDFCAIPNNRNNRKSNASNSLFSVPSTPVVMPARLKKIENGKVVDDIKLDPTLFIDPKILISSTPFSPGRKKRDHKSFSPLKDETSPSPRKEQLKLANERIQLSSLRRLNIEDDEDEDDDCEYIVPIEMPQRRTSRTSSNTTLDDLTAAATLPLADSPLNFPEILNNDGNADNINLTEKHNFGVKNNLLNHENGSEESFQSARDNFDKNNEINEADNQLSSLQAGLNFDLEVNNALGNLQQANGNACNETVNHLDGISLNLFMEDSQTNDDNHSKSFVVSLINETIDKLSKDIEEDTTDKNYTNKI